MGFGRVLLLSFAGIMLVGLGALMGIWSVSSGGGNTDGGSTRVYHHAASPPAPPSSTGDGGSNAPTAEPTDDPKAPAYTLAPKGESKPGEWNGIPMLVNTHMYDFTTINRTDVGLEPIAVKLRARQVKIVRRLRLLLPLVEKDLAPTARRVWIDLGARFFLKGSTQWFMRHYPTSKGFEVVLFDVLDLQDTYPPNVQQFFKKFEFVQKAVWTHDRGVEVKGKKMAHVKEKGQDDPHAVAIANDNRETWTIPSIDFAAWLQARYTEADFVVVKMDIEGGEWEVLAHLIRTGAIRLIDELMLECHPRVQLPSVHYMHQSCVDLVNHFRKMNIAAHRWV